MRLLARVFFTCTFLIFLICACSSQAGDSGAQASNAAPDFVLKDLNGGVHRMSDLRGNVVLLNFFATWCGPCRQEIPEFVEMYRRLRHEGLEIIGVSLDQGGASVLMPFVKHYKIDYPIVLGTSKVVTDFGGVKGIPNTFLIDRNGAISDHFVGYQPGYIVEASVKKLLRQKS